MAKRRIGSGIVAVGIVAALTGAVAYTTMGESDVEAVPVVESAAPVEARTTPDVEADAHRGDTRTQIEDQTQLTPPEAPELLAVGLPSLDPSMAAAANPTTAKSQYTVPAVDLPTGALLSQPVSGRKSSRFGNRFHPILKVWKLHSGLDFATSCGTPVGAAAAGKVTKVGWAGGNGMQVRIDHGQLGGYHVVTTYNHLSATGVRVGQQVAVHQGVGLVGNTGYSTGCHLHFEVIANGWFTNPEQWLNGQAVQVDTSGMNKQPATRPAASPTPTLPTDSPSPSPTPTLPPTPTVSPTATASPTQTTTPSVTPTASPTGTASPEPTCTPLPADPSAGPTTAPTADPTCVPLPTCSETPDPEATADPEPCNSPEPTVDPSGTATPEPTDTPSGSPTTEPTDSPSGSPTTEPTNSPTGTGSPSATTSATGPASPSATGADTATPASTTGLASSVTPTGTQQATHTPDATPTITAESTATVG